MASREATAADKLAVPAGGGLPALSVDVSLASATVSWRTCSHGAPCDGPEQRAKIDLTSDELPATADAIAIDAVPVGAGRFVAHVHVTSRAGNARGWDAILSAKDAAPIFAGTTGLGAGTPGDRTGTVVRIEDASNGTRSVVIGTVAENTQICGQSSTLLEPRGLDPSTMELRRATLRFSKAARAGALTVVAAHASASAPAPLVSPLSVASTSGGKATALVDGDAKNAWIETRPNDGHGEFVTLRTGPGIKVDRLRFVVAPDPLPQDYAAPRVFYVTTNDATFEVTMPDDAALHPGDAYDIALPPGTQTDCISIVLDESYAKIKAPNVGIGEVLGYTQFDKPNATLDDVALALAGGGANADAAATLLSRAGKEGVSAIDRVYGKLDAPGKKLAIDAAATASCEDAANVLASGLLDGDKQVAVHTEKRLERCGKRAAKAMAIALESGAAKSPRLLELFATLSPEAALPALATKLGMGSAEDRRAVRHAFAVATKHALPATLDGVAHDLSSQDARIDFWRAVAPRAGDLDDKTKLLASALAQSGDFATQWLVAPALASVAEKGDVPASAMLQDWLVRSDAWPLRARAAEVWPKGRDIPDATIAQVCADASPRVREALLNRVAELSSQRPSPGFVACAKTSLARDPWPFVRTAAIHDLAIFPADPSIDGSLAGALGDAAIDVRIAAANALGSRRAKNQTEALMTHLLDTKEDANVRAAVARALGQVCADAALPKLTSLAKDAALPQGSGQDIALDMAAIEALGVIHPSDLKSRLAPVLDRSAPPQARAAAARALEESDVCKGGSR
jgi:hypothetical protein